MRTSWVYRGAVVLVALATVAACAGGGGHAAGHSTRPSATVSTAVPASGSGSPSAAVSSLHWGTCTQQSYQHTYQCATLAVPLDYSGKVPGTINLALIRTPATDPSERIGSLLVNPGGPGESALSEWDFLSGTVDATLHAHFDVVGFDPRGVGYSTAVNCLNGPALDAFSELNFAPTTASQTSTLVAGAQKVASTCAAEDGTLLPFLGTANAARDMDRIRAALGDQKLTYLGFSYGTLLGATYAQEFPTHVRALVLDGAINPALGAVADTDEQSLGFQRQLDRFLAACTTASSCAWTYSGTAHAALTAILNRIATDPISVGARAVYAGQAFFAIGVVLYDQQSWPDLYEALQQAQNGNGSGLLQLSDDYLERNANGTYSNATAANLAIDCRDYGWPRGASAFLAAAKADISAAPDFGEANLDTTLPCAFWPTDASGTGAPGPYTAVGAPPILVVATTGDPATPYVDGQALAKQLSSGVLLTNVGEQHTAYGYSACVRRIADAYLISGKSPGPQTCNDENES